MDLDDGNLDVSAEQGTEHDSPVLEHGRNLARNLNCISIPTKSSMLNSFFCTLGWVGMILSKLANCTIEKNTALLHTRFTGHRRYLSVHSCLAGHKKVISMLCCTLFWWTRENLHCKLILSPEGCISALRCGDLGNCVKHVDRQTFQLGKLLLCGVSQVWTSEFLCPEVLPCVWRDVDRFSTWEFCVLSLFAKVGARDSCVLGSGELGFLAKDCALWTDVPLGNCMHHPLNDFPLLN